MHARRRTRGLTRGAIALLAALSVLAAVLLAGQRYFFCPLMNEASLDSCCTGEPRASGAQDRTGPALDREACCITRHFAAPAPTAVGASKLVIRSPVSTVLPAYVPLGSQTHARVPQSEHRFARAGPEGPSLREHRIRLMVSLT